MGCSIAPSSMRSEASFPSQRQTAHVRPRIIAFDESMRALPRVDRLVGDVFQKARTGRWTLTDLVLQLSPLIPRMLSVDELAASVDRLLRQGQLIAPKLGPQEARIHDSDGFPLLMSTRWREPDG